MTEFVYIIIPVYNAQKYLRKCVDSVLGQTMDNIRVILVDDGSSDRSGSICDAYAEADGRITVIHKENGGAICARNAGIEQLPEDGYATFCDADDCMPPDAVEKLYRLAKETRADIATGILQRFFGPGIRLRPDITPAYAQRRTYDAEAIREELLHSYFGVSNFHGYMPTKLYANRLLKLSRDFQCPARHFQEDIAFNLQMIFRANRVSVMPDVVYYYRMGGGTSRFMPSFWEDCLNLYRFKLTQIEKRGLPMEFRFTTRVELKNELWSWLEMYRLEKPNSIREEVERCCGLPEVQEAVNDPRPDYSGVPEFRELVRRQDADGILRLLTRQNKAARMRRLIKRLIFNL